MLKKLRLKFICINMTIVSIMLIFIMGMVIHFTRTNLEQASIQMLNTLASNPLYLIKPNDNMKISLPYFSLRLDNNGNLLETVSSYYNLTDGNYLHDIIETTSDISGKIGELETEHLRFMRIHTPKEQILVFMDTSHEQSTMATLTRNCMMTGLISFLAFLGISIFLANWAVKPVEQAWTQQKQFIADASHELKTPLTVILTNAEFLQSSEYDEANKSRFSQNIQTMAVQMKNLVEGLLELSRIDHGSMMEGMKKVDFSAICCNSIYLWEPLLFEHEIRLDTKIEPEMSFWGSELHLQQLLDILLDNAMKYSYPGTMVTMKLTKLPLACQLSIQSFGDPILPEDLSQLFKRFYRTDQSRQHSDSYGLGLSIAEGIVQAHHGKIWAESKDGSNTFYVRFPTR